MEQKFQDVPQDQKVQGGEMILWLNAVLFLSSHGYICPTEDT